ncbi:MAG: AI-2E family transporter [Acidimicrobiia bacterium]|nr:AI-2E family transporter [Acidimicrobiia bacterium]MDH3470749.1 AI-2E family transporter [Acidimicrobiia bacterium]
MVDTVDAEPRIAGGFLKGAPVWVPKMLVTAALGVAVFIFAFGVVRQLRTLLILVLISAFLSTALEPGVAYLATRGWKRGLATGFMFMVVIVGGGTFVALMVPLIVDQVILFVDRLPGYVDDLGEFAARFGIEFSSERVTDAVTNIDRSLQDVAADVAGSLFGVGSRLLNTFFQGLTIALFTFYLTAEAPKIRRGIASMLPKNRQVEVIRVWDIAIEKTGGYFYSRALLAGISAVITWVVLTIIDVPFPIALALWMGVLSQFVPVVGTYIGGALPALIAVLESPIKALWVVIYVAMYQQFENYVLSPRITARTMSLHPAVSFGSAIAGGTLLGAPGALMALPVAATLQAFISTYIRRYELIDDLQHGNESKSEREAKES